eukprot:scaffold306029_cov27-Tisochrysis_lutea.AAC.1
MPHVAAVVPRHAWLAVVMRPVLPPPGRGSQPAGPGGWHARAGLRAVHNAAAPFVAAVAAGAVGGVGAAAAVPAAAAGGGAAAAAAAVADRKVPAEVGARAGA